ncbi:MAG TPA: PHP domain-containing protein [Coriobacteriia bacterium]|nr:PHP domain-containing protein [Coriobacteriia bacterium]
MKADLHVHSTASDGTARPADLVALALERGLRVLAITDHDSVEGLPEALDAAKGTPLTLIPALELSAVQEGRDVHILGYFVRHDDAALAAQLADMREARLNRAVSMVRLLGESGYELDVDSVLELSDGGAVGRSHVARALVDAGHAESIRDAFERLIGRGRPYYVSKDARTPAEAIQTVRRAGGLAVVAHPGVNGLDPVIDSMIAEGLGGIEAYHADHSAEQRAHYAEMASAAGLLVTGGSDFHGEAAPNPALGSVRLPEGAIAALLDWGREHG